MLSKSKILKYSTLELIKISILLSYVIFWISIFEMTFIYNKIISEYMVYTILSLFIVNFLYSLRDYVNEKLVY